MHVDYLFTRKVPGDSMTIQGLAKGKLVDATITALPPPLSIVEETQLAMEANPESAYFVVGGLVFVAISRQYLGMLLPRSDAALFDRIIKPPNEPGEQAILLVNVLHTPATIGYETGFTGPVDRFDGEPVQNLAKLRAKVESAAAQGKMLKFSVAETNLLILDPQECDSLSEQLTRNYGIPEGQIARMKGPESSDAMPMKPKLHVITPTLTSQDVLNQ